MSDESQVNIAHRERAVIDATRRFLEDSYWTLREEPIVGTARPDLVFSDPSGHVVVAEVKLGRGASHFGWLAQLASLKHALEQTDEVAAVRGVLLTDENVSASLMEAADELGVELVTEASDDPSALAAAFIDRVTTNSS
jgi:RecB family endonuclease NucS